MATVRKVSWTHKGVTKQAWQVTYTDPATKKRPTKNCRTKKEADAYRLKVEKEIEAGIHTAVARTKTIAEVCDAYLCNTEERLRDGRIGRARYLIIKLTLERDLVPFLGTVLISDLTPAMIEEHYSKLLKLRTISPYILRARFVIIKQAEDFARRREWTSKSVVPLAMQSLRGLERPEPKKFTPEQVLSVLATAARRRGHMTERGCLYLQCFVNLAAFCGLRWGEISALKEENILFGEGMIRIRHSVTQWDMLKGPKSKAGNRDVPMPGHVATMLREWLGSHVIAEERGLIFRNRNGRALASGNFHRQKWLPLLAAAGLSDGEPHGDAFHFHSLRGFAASWWVDNGVPVTTVAKWLGHSKPDMTLDFYARSMASQSGQREAADRMATRLLAQQRVLLDTTTAREHQLSA